MLIGILLLTSCLVETKTRRRPQTDFCTKKINQDSLYIISELYKLKRTPSMGLSYSTNK